MSSQLRRVQMGDQLPARTTPVVTADLIYKYAEASGDMNPIHIDPVAARAVGHPDVIAHGMWSMAQLADLVQEWAGVSMIDEMKARFAGVVTVGDQLTCRGVVREIPAPGKAVVEAWTEDSDGRRMTAGDFLVQVDTAS